LNIIQMTSCGGTALSEYIALSKYARFIPKLGRRENMREIAERYCDFWNARNPGVLPPDMVDMITTHQVFPSMRALSLAGPALESSNIGCYNCAYCAIDKPIRFAEILYILMHGTGVGISVERTNTIKLPSVGIFTADKPSVVCIFEDSKEGWFEGFNNMISALFDGIVPVLDTTLVRPRGSRLKTFGGIASGPEPLIELSVILTEIFKSRAGHELRPIDCMDIVCHIAIIIISGGLRRSALMTLVDVDDELIITSKNLDIIKDHPHRRITNISVVYNSVEDYKYFDKHWASLRDSGTGEPGIINRVALKEKMKEAGRIVEGDESIGVNPCGEVILRSCQMCNLSTARLTSDDDLDNMRNILKKVKYATILGTLQATLTKFRCLSPEWKHNCEKDRLLGVSLLGIADCPVRNIAQFYRNEIVWRCTLIRMRKMCMDTNVHVAKLLGIKSTRSATCVKPDGTLSLLANSSAGIHPRFAPYYIRRVIGSSLDPLTQFMIESGVPHESSAYDSSSVVFSFPIASPKTSTINIKEYNMLKFAREYEKWWCTHKVSATIYVTDWDKIGKTVHDDIGSMGGFAFFGKTDGSYAQMPMEAISEDEYTRLNAKFPIIQWENFIETNESCTIDRQLTCTAAGGCY
jgi:ribonucleoside-diphosphate reductase alpha chain